MAYNTTILADSPLTYFQLNETTGTTFANSGSLGGNSGTAGSGVTRGQSGGVDGSNSALFNGGANAYVLFTQNANFMSDNQFSVEAWVKTTNGGATKTIVAYNVGSRGFTLGVNSSNRATFSISNNNGTSSVTASGSTALLNDGNWHHLVGVASSATITIYVDKVATANTSALGGTYGINSDLSIGQSGSGAFNGYIDEVAVYDGALTSTQVNTHFNAWVQQADVSYAAQAMTVSLTAPNPVVTPVKNNSIAADPGIVSLTAPGGLISISPNITAAASTVSLTAPDAVGLGNVRKYSGNSEGGDSLDAGGTGQNRVFYNTSTSTYSRYWVKFDISNINYSVSAASLQLKGDVSGSGSTVTLKERNANGTVGATITTATISAGVWTFDVSSLVSDWVNQVKTNNGFYVESGASGSSSADVYGLTYPDSSARPLLTVTLSNSLPAQNVNVTAPVVGTATFDWNGGTPAVEHNPDVTYPASAMTASITMPGGVFNRPINIAASPSVASLEMASDVTVATEGNVTINAEAASASTFLVPPAFVNDAPISELSDDYYLRLWSQVGQAADDDSQFTGNIWLRLDETSGTNAENRLGTDAIYVGGMQFGAFGPENRRVVGFDGIDDFIRLPDTDRFSTGGTFEFTFRTEQANTTIVEGIDYINNNFGGALKGSYIALVNGKISILPNYNMSKSGYANQFTGRTVINDNKWHHVVVTIAQVGPSQTEYPGQLAVYIDGKLEFRRTLVTDQIVTAIPDSIGGGSFINDVNQPTAFGGIPYNPFGFTRFKGEMMEFMFRPNFALSETEAVRNYYAVFGIKPIYTAPATASFEMLNAKGKGNQKRALGLYYRTGVTSTFTNIDYKGSYDWVGISNVTTAPFDMAGFKVFPQSIERNVYEPYGYLGGRFYDEITGEARFIDVGSDIDASEYDLVFFINTPPISDQIYFGTTTFRQRFEKMIDDLRNAQDRYGFSIWAPQPDVAVQLGIVSQIEVHSMRRGDGRIYDNINEDGSWGDEHSMVATPWNSAGWSNKAEDYYDTHAINKYRITANIDGLTTLGGYIIQDYVYGINAHGQNFTPPFEAWDYEERPNGLLIGDEVFYPQDFFNSLSSSSWLSGGGYNQRRRVISVPADAVKAGTVVTRENAQYWNRNTLVTNPWANNATSIVVNPGDPLKGRPAGGKIYVNFMEGLDANNGRFQKQIVPPNSDITNPIDWETPEMRDWEYSSTRVSRSATTVNGDSAANTNPPPIPAPGDVQAEAAYRNWLALQALKGQGANLITVNETEKYPVQSLTNYSMLNRAFHWLSDRQEIGSGDVVIRPTAMTADLIMKDPAIVAERDAEINAEAAVASLTMVKPLQAFDPNVTIHALPASVNLTMTGYGKTIQAQPMSMTLEMVENIDMVHANGEQVVLFLHYTDAVIYMKEDS